MTAFCYSTLKMLLFFFIVYVVSVKKCSVIIIFVPPYIMSFYLVVFKVYSLSFVLSNLIMMCLYVSLLGFIEILGTVGLKFSLTLEDFWPFYL